MYSIVQYGGMIADRLRMDAYVRALGAVVRPGAVVADIGAGGGILSLVACRLGAARVYAIEPNDAISLLRDAAIANGFEQRIVPLQDISLRVTLPELADVVVSDLHGVLPPFQGSLAALADARARLLRPGGAMVPACDTIYAALVESDELYARHARAWDEPPLGLDLGSARALAVNSWTKGRVEPGQLLSEPRAWAVLDYAAGVDHRISGTVAWTGLQRAGVAHGLLVWFDSRLAEGVELSNSPACEELVYGSAFFPLERPVSLSAAHEVTVALRADPSEDDYLWSWRVEIRGGGIVEHAFDQSTFRGQPLSLERLRRGASSYKPALGPAGEVDRFVLDAMDGSSTVEEIAERAQLRFPDELRDAAAALARVAKLSQKLGR
jgi:type I protein arginine methyltransferase